MVALPSCTLLLIFTALVDAGVHLPIFRRGGRLARHESANITFLSATLSMVEAKYARTYTDVDGNRIVRRWQDGGHGSDEYLLSFAGSDDAWFAEVLVGDPPQVLELDLDMLSPDFYTIMTTSGRGSKYDTFGSTSHVSSNEYAHAVCRAPTDIFHLPSTSVSSSQIRLSFPVCQPGKYSLHTLSHSGSVLGLSPPSARSLTRLASQTFVDQLRSANHIDHNIVSITILDSTSGVLSIGTTLAREMESIKVRWEKELKYLGNPDRTAMEEEIRGALAFAVPDGTTHKEHFQWTDVGNGAVAGWHMTLVTGIWVNGLKVLKNQPVLFDINCPFILAPAGTASGVYDAIPGARRLGTILGAHEFEEANESPSGERIGSFFAFPCLNEVDVAFEIAGWKFPVMKGEGTNDDDIYGAAGGRFSLGKVGVSINETNNDSDADNIGTGYCVGRIAETDMGMRTKWHRAGMRDVWVLGEPFFRGLGVTFDLGNQNGKGGKIGLRVY